MVMSMGAKEENVCSERNNGLEFENRMKNLYTYFGFKGVETTKKSGDGGIDLVMFSEDNGVQRKCFSQCKEWYSKNVGITDLQAFVGACTEHENSNGKLLLYFDTTSDYTKQALGYANSINLIGRIELILHNGKDIQGIERDIMKEAVRIELKKELYDEIKKEAKKEAKEEARKEYEYQKFLLKLNMAELQDNYNNLQVKYNDLNCCYHKVCDKRNELTNENNKLVDDLQRIERYVNYSTAMMKEHNKLSEEHYEMYLSMWNLYNTLICRYNDLVKECDKLKVKPREGFRYGNTSAIIDEYKTSMNNDN